MAEHVDYKTFVSTHQEQLKHSGIPLIYWPKLYEKLQAEEFDAGDHFMIQKVLLSNEGTDEENSDNESTKDQGEEDKQESKDQAEEERDDYTWRVIVYSEDGINPEDPCHIYLIDHAWTYRTDEARAYLREAPGLLQRMVSLFDLSAAGKQDSEIIEEVFNEMWKYNQTYQIETGLEERKAEDMRPYWYVMDEFGSRIQHSDTPSVRMVPFCYNPRMCSYTVMWPIKQLEFEDEVTRDYVEFAKSDEELRKLHLIPWQPYDCSEDTFSEGAEDYEVKYRILESLPKHGANILDIPDRKLHIFSEVVMISKFYEPNEVYELTESDEDIDVKWICSTQVFDYRKFFTDHPRCFLNSFPCDAILTVKSVMYDAAMHYLLTKGMDTSWLQKTYPLKTKLKEFVAEFQKREKRGDYNTWIIKPCYLARSLDMQITDNLNYILRLSESRVKMASEYIDRPVLYNLEGVGLVKWDLRYMILLHTVKPLKVYMHKTFAVRCANKPFSMSDFDDFEMHFTTMNTRGLEFLLIQPEEFVSDFEKQYPAYKWSDIEAEIIHSAKLLMEAVTYKDPPHGIAHSPQSRALYGLDVMLKWTKDKTGKDTMQPVIFECNFDPNLHRQFLARNEFFTDVCKTLFLNDTKDVPLVEL